ncbi:MAG: response regulator [Leptospiraceae bacterium]|nr:response regulator [Leptospiraceae bacterium]MDW8307586.1 response regulator [Leptospiraceae bacterium]
MSGLTDIILVDDEPIANQVHRAIVEESQIAPATVFDDPQKALAELQKKLNEESGEILLLLDLNMPQLSGWEFLSAIEKKAKEISSQHRKKIRVFILSSSLDPQDKEKAASHPWVIAFVEKPLTKLKWQKILAELGHGLNGLN